MADNLVVIASKLSAKALGESAGLGARVAHAVNEASEKVLGRDRRFRFGVEGQIHLPSMRPDSLALGSSERQGLASTRVYLLPGLPWPGIKQNGATWLAPWAKALEAQGVGRAVPIPYGGDSALLSNLRTLIEPIFHVDAKRIDKLISEDLARNPLKPGETVSLIAHSYGNKVGAAAADRLRERGVPIKGMIFIEDRMPVIGKFAPDAPAIPRVLEVENDPGKPLTRAAGTQVRQLVIPELTHMQFVLTPPRNLVESLLKELAAPAR